MKNLQRDLKKLNRNSKRLQKRRSLSDGQKKNQWSELQKYLNLYCNMKTGSAATNNGHDGSKKANLENRKKLCFPQPTYTL